MKKLKNFFKARKILKISLLIFFALFLAWEIYQSIPAHIENFDEITQCDVFWQRRVANAVLNDYEEREQKFIEKWGELRPDEYEEISCEDLDKQKKNQTIMLSLSINSLETVKLIFDMGIIVDRIIISGKKWLYKYNVGIGPFSSEIELLQRIKYMKEMAIKDSIFTYKDELEKFKSDKYFEMLQFKILLKNKDRAFFFSDERFQIQRCEKNNLDELRIDRQELNEYRDLVMVSSVFYRDVLPFYQRWQFWFMNIKNCLSRDGYLNA